MNALALDIRPCLECGKDTEYRDMGRYGPSGLCPNCYTAWHRAYFAARPASDAQGKLSERVTARCGFCGAGFYGIEGPAQAAKHEGNAHRYECAAMEAQAKD